MDGEGNFNWRMVFPFEYLPSENIIVVKKKVSRIWVETHMAGIICFVCAQDHFYSLTKTERHLPPILTLQIWDNDLFNPDDFIGQLQHSNWGHKN